jgi:hypothetical protein
MLHHGLKPNQNTKGGDKLSSAGRPHLKQQRQEQAQSLQAIPLKVALPRCGGQTNRHNKRKLVIHLHHLDFIAAVDWLGRNIPDVLSLSAAAPTAQLGLKLTVPAPSRSPTTLKKTFSGGLQSFCHPQQAQSQCRPFSSIRPHRFMQP